jgi:hypothetical protein
MNTGVFCAVTAKQVKNVCSKKPKRTQNLWSLASGLFAMVYLPNEPILETQKHALSASKTQKWM